MQGSTLFAPATLTGERMRAGAAGALWGLEQQPGGGALPAVRQDAVQRLWEPRQALDDDERAADLLLCRLLGRLPCARHPGPGSTPSICQFPCISIAGRVWVLVALRSFRDGSHAPGIQDQVSAAMPDRVHQDEQGFESVAGSRIVQSCPAILFKSSQARVTTLLQYNTRKQNKVFWLCNPATPCTMASRYFSTKSATLDCWPASVVTVLCSLQRQAYNCVHNVLKAHAAAVQEFRTIVPGGKISINLNSDWGEPYSKSSPADKVTFDFQSSSPGHAYHYYAA